ncbi:Uncharacterised protein [Salmonella enterica subsp. enterica serovar Typhi]|nr:Uncharacterised protein [Salmonella enterica subsp. enterica serovar Typhi]CIM70880.1 Uncharacterised protein [Salmonella enterica subsp. enterica serovar Typhi]CIN38172.1 Uncharacterised protein [Salmonella enterica subsp. enterica serovar Typhi]CIN38738.1 Uncharacterised protein [Salmonella enterica subsp. enterica serovar Typhi]
MNVNRLAEYIDLLKLHEIEFKKHSKNTSLSNIDKILFWLLTLLIVLAFVFIGFYAYFKPSHKVLAYISIGLVSFSYVLLFLTPFIKMYEQRKSIKYFFSFPLSSSIDQNISNKSKIDEEFLPKFISLGKDVLELGLMEVKHEREFLNKRIALLIGPVDKIGILPGGVSMLITIAKPLGKNDWVMALAYGYIGLVILSMSFFYVLVKYDRIIALTEIALSRCNSNNQDPNINV